MLKIADCVAVFPAAQLVHPNRQVVVVQRDDGGDAVGYQLVNERVVKRNTLFVDLAVGSWDDARPRQRKAVGRKATLGHQRNVLFVVVVMVGRNRVVGKRLFGLAV